MTLQRDGREMNEKSGKKLIRVNRRLTDEQRARHAAIRAAAKRDFPPKNQAKAL